MRSLLVVISLLLLGVSCKTKKIYIETEKTVEVPAEPVAEPVPEAEPEPEEERLVFSGYYNLNGPSDVNCIYLDEKIENVVDIETDCQSLVTTNPQNKTLGQFPTISASGLLVREGIVTYTRDLNYTSGHDIEEDTSGANITGSRRTDIVLSFDDKGKLLLKIKIYANKNNSNLNYIVATRTFKEE